VGGPLYGGRREVILNRASRDGGRDATIFKELEYKGGSLGGARRRLQEGHLQQDGPARAVGGMPRYVRLASPAQVVAQW
jgi:phage tail tape-measure protein